MSATAAPSLGIGSKPQLLFFHSARSGPSRRAEGYLAQVLQRRANHHAFQLRRIDVDRHPAIARHFAVRTLPTLIVIDATHVEARVEAPAGCGEIRAALARWLA
jgi:thioredoxin-like negative regulator of GroEL